MAKYLHRTFEMFDSYDEAVATLNVRPRDAASVSKISDSTFEHLSITQSGTVVNIAFKQTGDTDDPSTCPFREDFLRLAELLQNDSRVIVDFAGVDQLPANSIETLEIFYRRLKAKGSRLVLCNLQPDAKSRFFPGRVPR